MPYFFVDFHQLLVIESLPVPHNLLSYGLIVPPRWDLHKHFGGLYFNVRTNWRREVDAVTEGVEDQICFDVVVGTLFLGDLGNRNR